MKKIIIYFVLIFAIITACEDIYDPKIEQVSSALTIDARIVYGKSDNFIRLYQSLGFTDENTIYPPITNASVSLIDNNNSEYNLPEMEDGVFHVNIRLNPGLEYKIKVSYQREIFESDFESVPELPEIDSIFGLQETRVIEIGGEKDADNFRKSIGMQLYANMNNEDESHYFRFTARKTFQYVYYIEVIVFGEPEDIPVYAWNTFFPQGSFNIAAPPEYSSSIDIKKHPLFFMEKSAGVKPGEFFYGWILYLHQYSLSKSSYNFYKDLNNQLDADGRLFDPLYVQARSNIKCTSNPDKIILGNFEISTHKERRYHIRFQSDEIGYLIKPIPYFYYIPQSGEQVDIPPDFWETPQKHYPND